MAKLDDLKMVQRHVAEGKQLISRQHDLIVELERNGHEVAALNPQALHENYPATSKWELGIS